MPLGPRCRLHFTLCRSSSSFMCFYFIFYTQQIAPCVYDTYVRRYSQIHLPVDVVENERKTKKIKCATIVFYFAFVCVCITVVETCLKIQ